MLLRIMCKFFPIEFNVLTGHKICLWAIPMNAGPTAQNSLVQPTSAHVTLVVMAKGLHRRPATRKHRRLETIALSTRDQKDKTKVNGIIYRMHARTRDDCIRAGKIIISMLNRLEI